MAELRGRPLRILIHTAASLCFLLFGYDQGVFGGVLSTESFLSTYNVKSTDSIIGTTSAIYSIGAAVGCILSAIYGLKLGRRMVIIIGCFIVIIGAAIQAASPSLNVMIAGRVIAGLGVGANTSTVPIWIAEISSAKNRGRNVAIQLEIVLVGFMAVYWFTYGMSFVKSQVAFRLPIAGQALFPLLALPLLFILPESPRVLFYWGREEEGTQLLARLQDTTVDDAAVQKEKDEILETIAIEKEQKQNPITLLLFDKSPIRYGRRALITLIVFMLQQFGGCTFVAYYAPIVFGTSVGLSPNMSAIMSCVMATAYAVGGIFPILAIEKLGRRNLMIWGAVATSTSFIILTALISRADQSQGIAWGAAIMVIVFILVFAMSWDVLPWVYGAEIMPLNLRHVNGAIGAFGEWIFQFTVLMMAPAAIASTGWKIYCFFMVFNIAAVVFVFFFCPETSQKSLEEIDYLFDKEKRSSVIVTEVQTKNEA